MKKLLFIMSLITFMSVPLMAEDTCNDDMDNCEENKEENKSVVCLTKDQACIVLAALNCFAQNRLARNDAPVESDSEFPPADDDVEELRQAVCELQQQITQCCRDMGGCD